MRDGGAKKGRESKKKHGAQSLAKVLIGVASKGSLKRKKRKCRQESICWFAQGLLEDLEEMQKGGAASGT